MPAFMPNEEPLRRLRRLMSSQIGSAVALAKFDNVQKTEIGRFLLRTLNDPKRLLQHIKTYGTLNLIGIIDLVPT